jgi:short-subunit dehydrogenase
MTYSSVLITGASSGIGRALARELARRGASVGAMARRAEALEELKAEIASDGKGRCLAIPGDATEPNDLRRALEETEKAFGPLDLVIANAGVGQTGLVHLLPPGTSRRTYLLNVVGAVETVEAALPGMLERGRGQVAIVSSLSSYRGLPTAAAYSSSKACVNAYCEALSGEVRRRDVTVSIICPGFVDTPMLGPVRKQAFAIWDADRAARYIADGLEKRRRWIAFPKRTRLGMMILRWLPAPVFEFFAGWQLVRPIERRAQKRAQKDDAATREK